jgi:hypothetical protein
MVLPPMAEVLQTADGNAASGAPYWYTRESSFFGGRGCCGGRGFANTYIFLWLSNGFITMVKNCCYKVGFASITQIFCYEFSSMVGFAIISYLFLLQGLREVSLNSFWTIRFFYQIVFSTIIPLGWKVAALPQCQKESALLQDDKKSALHWHVLCTLDAGAICHNSRWRRPAESAIRKISQLVLLRPQAVVP